MSLSATPLTSGCRTKAGELTIPKHLISFWKSFDMSFDPWSWRRMRPRAVAGPTPTKWRMRPCRIGSRAYQRLSLDDACVPMNSPEQWSMAMKT